MSDVSDVRVFYVYAEDLVSCLIGPFAGRAEAETHIAFCETRGDGAETRVIDEAEAARLRPDVCYELTAEADRTYDGDLSGEFGEFAFSKPRRGDRRRVNRRQPDRPERYKLIERRAGESGRCYAELLAKLGGGQ